MKKSSDTLWYGSPAQNWNESLPLGNGRIGANVFGGAKSETYTLNEDTLWSGYPRFSERKDMSAVYRKIEEMVFQNKLSEAKQLSEEQFGDFLVQMYLPFGNLSLSMAHGEQISGYQRELSLADAVHTVSYTCDGVSYERKTFISAKDQLLCVRITADRPGAVSFHVDLNGKLKSRKNVSAHGIFVEGNCPVCMAPYGQTHANEDKKIYSEKASEQGVGYYAGITVKNLGGILIPQNGGLAVQNANEAELYFAIRTSFNGYHRHPVLQGKEYREACIKDLKAAEDKSFDELLKDSVKDYRRLYNRVKIDIGKGNEKLPTDRRLEELQNGESDNALFALLFNFGRYLAICSSRKGTQPANLQGIWNEKTSPPWSSNYTLNINTQMNYWPHLQCNLKECAEPILTMTKELCKNGRKTAKQYYGVTGSVSHHASDLWRLTHPSTNLLNGSCQWGFWNMSSGWLARHLFDYYLYNGNKNFLKKQALPVMREFTQFYSQLLIADDNGQLILCPSTSPENSFIYKNEKIPVSKTTAMTMAILRELFSNYKAACEELEQKDRLYDTICNQLPKLKGYEIACDGSICEWDQSYEESEPTHRHLSHLYGLFPGTEITPEKTPELAEASKNTLIKRGDEGTGWSLAWKINLWARLQNGDKALELLKRQLKPVDSGDEDHDTGGGSYINLLCAHPPFQIDGNFGATSGIAQMLLQCDGLNVTLLPALPKQWQNGSIKGMCLHGGATIDFSWENGKVVRYQIHGAKYNYIVKTTNGLI